MKKLLKVLKGKISLVNAMNLCALWAAISTINVTCWWAHHQPEVPQELKRFRKF